MINDREARQDGVETPWAVTFDALNIDSWSIAFHLGPRPFRKEPRLNLPESKGEWNLIRIALKKRWAQLTDDDLKYAEAGLEELIIRIQLRTAASREAVEGFFKARQSE